LAIRSFSGGEALFVDVVGVTGLREAHGFDGQEHQRVLVGRHGGVGDDEGHGGLVGVVLARGSD
jgi:hypothetical protein